MRWPLLLLFLAAPAVAGPAEDLGSGFRALRSGDFASARTFLTRAAASRTLVNHDYALFLLAEAEFYGGAVAGAGRRFEEVARIRRSRFAPVAGWRAADCLWAEGRRREAAILYDKLLRKRPLAGDAAVARFHIAEQAEAVRSSRAPSLWRLVVEEFPGHPLADEAAHRLRSASRGGETVSPEERLRRAALLTEKRRWQEALDELARLPSELPPSMRAERDYQIGMTKFHMRRDYPKAAELLLGVAPLLQGERAASAAFHGARALSRVDRDDEAIRGYGDVVKRFPRSRFAAEAQYLSAWLDFNRGSFRASLPGLEETLERFPRSPFAADAAWYIALAHYFLGEPPQALAALARYERIAGDGDGRVSYWRARSLIQAGREGEGTDLLHACTRRFPYTFYGIMAGVRLAEPGDPAGSPRPAAAPAPRRPAAVRDPSVARADELWAAGLDVEGGFELERDEAGVLRRLGAARGLLVLLDRYPALQAYHRAYELGGARGRPALESAPEGAARVFWEAAYPLAWRDLVEKYGPPAGNPDYLLYAIMRKESGFSPHDVSPADARGLLQMIPPTSARVAASAGADFHADELFDPDTNIRLGAAYIGALVRKFHGQIPLAVGAFNAGPGAMARWCDRYAGRPLDELVELVAYAQTREYIKRVIGIYARYRRLYGPAPYRPALQVDTSYEKGAPDF